MRLSPHIEVDDRDIEFAYVRASGPGGQHVNKVSTAVELRFDAMHCAALTDEARERLLKLAGRRATRDGVIVIAAQRFREQARNREDALARLVALLRSALVRPVPRRPTRPSRAARARRLDAKRHRSVTKQRRSGATTE